MNRSIQNNIAILLTCYNRKDTTIQCLDALYACDMPYDYQFDVFLVDDGSTDGTADVVKDNYPKVNIIKGTGNLYWNRGMHLAWQSAVKVREYDFYLWLNDDTILFKDSLNVLLNTSNSLNDISIVVGNTYSNDKKVLTYGGRSKMGNILNDSNNVISCHHFNGNIILIPKFVFKKVGMNDYFFKHALGDFDYGMRATYHGINSYVAPGVLGICESHPSLPTWCNPNVRFGKRWQAFKTPLGHNPEEYFVYEKRHNGIFMAIFHYITNYCRVFLPMLWK